MKQKEIWADCIECDYFQELENRQCCNKYDLSGLPNEFSIGTTKKCCSSFSSKKFKYKGPVISTMEEGVLYFYNPNNPNVIVEDIDL